MLCDDDSLRGMKPKQRAERSHQGNAESLVSCVHHIEILIGAARSPRLSAFLLQAEFRGFVRSCSVLENKKIFLGQAKATKTHYYIFPLQSDSAAARPDEMKPASEHHTVKKCFMKLSLD